MRSGRPMKKESVVEELLMEIQATALTGIKASTHRQQNRELFKRIVKAAFYTQSVHKGLITPGHQINGHLMELMGYENLN